MSKEQNLVPALEIPNITLAFLVQELQPQLLNAYVNKIQQMSNQILKFKIHTKTGDRTLLITSNSIYFTNYSTQAKPNPTSFASFLNKHLYNERILKFEQITSERIIVLEFRSCKLYCELFAQGNIILTDLNNQILMPFKPKSWSVRTLRKGETYQLPPARGSNPFTVSVQEFSKAIQASPKNLVQSLIATVNLAPVIAEQICADIKLEKTIQPNTLTSKQIQSLFHQLQFYYIQSLQKIPQPSLLENPTKTILLPYSLPLHVQFVSKEYTSFTEALDELNLGKITQSNPQEVEEQKTQTKKFSELEYSIQQQHVLFKECEENAVLYAQLGEKIYENYSALSEVILWIQENTNPKINSPEILEKLKQKFPFIQEMDLRKKELIVDL